MSRMGILLSTDPLGELLGAQVPAGFWDPLGVSVDNAETKYREHRLKELKHKPAVLATGRFFLGSAAAISNVFGWNWALILVYVAFCEISLDPSPGPKARVGGFGLLT